MIILTAFWLMYSPNDPTTTTVKFSELRRLFIEERVETFKINENNRVEAKLKTNYGTSGSPYVIHDLRSLEIFYADFADVITSALEDPKFEYNYEPGMRIPWWVSLLPYVILIAVFFFIWNSMMNRSGMGGDKGAMRFGKARTKIAGDDKKKVTFADVAGAEEEKEELSEIVDFLKGPQKYITIGARIPKGVLLVGPPGTGKTLIAKAVAGEAGVQFLSISGSDFVELYVGVGASRVRDLFDQAKKAAPSIIFIDEIDAVGRQRGAGLGGGHDEREQTLNQLLVEMDGFATNEGVIIIAATNRADILDNALLRPGRFDRQVYIGMPDIKGREEILKVHARGKILGEDISLSEIAKGTIGFTGADLENLLNEAALLAARGNKRFITMPDIEEATLKVMAGPEKKSRVVTEKSRKITAYHEAGHAIAAYHLEHVDPVHLVTIVPRGQSGGMTVFRPQEDKDYRSRSELFESIVSMLGGRIAEKIFLDDISTGAGADIQHASAMARSMVMKYGMSDAIGPISFDNSSHSVFIGRDFSQTKSYSEKTAAAIDDEVKAIFDAASQICEDILTEHKQLVLATVECLLENESINGDDFKYFCENGGKLPPKKETPDNPSEHPDTPEKRSSEFPEIPDLGSYFDNKDK
ncbi:MAG: ATP-dependent zinc metalloprotease FtsH [Oscillospiraceae bacterium]|nr:ATP-dependent zinc metalloprotease FtsH [Oscillospiraceae bacterium]